jgi:hypothetical protein
MAFMTVKLTPGVHLEQTPLLLQAGIIQSNNIRWREGLPEKMGGWTKFTTAGVTPAPLAGPIRELWTWEDLDSVLHLAAAGEDHVFVLTGGMPVDVVPQSVTRNPTNIAVTSGSPLAVVTDAGSNASIYESVTLQTPYGFAASGGFAIYPGSYPIVSVADTGHYTINIGKNATVTAASGVPATITSIVGTSVFRVTLDNHGLSAGANFSIILPTIVGGVVLSGFYTIQTVVDANNFTILAPNAATSTVTVNYGNVNIQLIQWIVTTPGPPPTVAAGAYTHGYYGIPVPANPGGAVVAGMTVLDSTTNTVLGTVKSWGPISITQNTTAKFAAGATVFNMSGNASGGIIPGQSVFDNSIGSALGTVLSYNGSTMTLTAGAPFYSKPLNVTALGPLVNGAYGLFMPADPLPIGPPLHAYLVDGASPPYGDLLGLVGTWRPIVVTYPNGVWTTGSANIFFGQTAASGPVVPGMTAIAIDVAGSPILGTVQTYSGTVCTLTAPISVASPGSTRVQFTSNGVNVLGFASPVTVASATPVISFPDVSTDSFTFSSSGANVLVLNAFLTVGAPAGHTLAFIGGAPTPPAGTTPVTADDWCMFNFGSTLMINPQDGPIFSYDPTTGLSNALLVPNAPSIVHGMFLAMPQQQIVAYGASVQGVQDPMLVAFSDTGNFNVWTAGSNNQAGTYRLSRGSKIVGGIQAPQQAMLWTDVGLWLMTYIGYPDVWGFSEIAQECGLIAKKAVNAIGSQVFWMGLNKFWTFSGGQVAPIPCEVWDAVYQNLNTDLVDLIRCGTDTGFDVVKWFYPSLATKQPGALLENDSWIQFNRSTGEWDYSTPIDVFGDGNVGGQLISDWIDANVYGNPISAYTDSTGTLSQLMFMNSGVDADTEPLHWWFRTGLFMLSEGEDFIFVDRCRPDFKWREFSAPSTPSAQVEITLYTQGESDNPSKPPNVYGPFIVDDTTGSFDPRARGRYFSLKVEGDDLGSFVRLGAMKFRFAPDGRAG